MPEMQPESEGVMTGKPRSEEVTPILQPAERELVAFAAAARGWDPDELMSAMLAARHAGWDFDAVYREVSRLLMRRDGDPAALRHAARHPTRREETAAYGPAAAARARELYPNLRHRDPKDAA